MPLFLHFDSKFPQKLSSSSPIGLDCMICSRDCFDILEGMCKSPINREGIVGHRTSNSAV